MSTTRASLMSPHKPDKLPQYFQYPLTQFQHSDLQKFSQTKTLSLQKRIWHAFCRNRYTTVHNLLLYLSVLPLKKHLPKISKVETKVPRAWRTNLCPISAPYNSLPCNIQVSLFEDKCGFMWTLYKPTQNDHLCMSQRLGEQLKMGGNHKIKCERTCACMHIVQTSWLSFGFLVTITVNCLNL